MAVATGAVFGSRALRAATEDASDGKTPFRAGVTADDCARSLGERLRVARARIGRAATLIDVRFPAVRSKILADAEQVMRGMLQLPGSTEPSFVGSPPKWTTPRYGDDEYLWSLNRMWHWTPLLRAHALTGEDRFAEKVVTELDDWIRAAAPPAERYRTGRFDANFFADAAPPPWRSLEVGIRMYTSWTLLCEHLAGSKFLPPERVERMARSVALHAQVLSIVPSRKWPEADHNHFFMEMLGLLAAADLFPEVAGASSWADQARRDLDRCVAVQFTPDGGHIEGCPSYHNICVELLARFVAQSRAVGRPVAPETARMCAAAAEHAMYATRTNGSIVPWGDSSPGESWIIALVWAAKATSNSRYLQQLGAVVGASRVIEACAAEIWVSDEPEELLARLAKPPDPPFALWRRDRGNDQVMVRSAWARDALSVFFACHSPLHPKSGHAHVDLGGFDFCAFGRPLVVDPGPFTYRECDDRRIFKSAQYHSVLTIDHREPFEYLNRWRYSPQKLGRVSAVRDEENQMRIESFHLNYWPAVCHRTLALVADRLLVVIDSVAGLKTDSTIQILFHVDDPTVAWEEAPRRARAEMDGVGLAITASEPLKCEMLPGRVSERYDTAHPSTRVCFSDHGGLSRRTYVSVLVPFRSGREPAAVRDLAIVEDTRQCRFEFEGAVYRVGYSRDEA